MSDEFTDVTRECMMTAHHMGVLIQIGRENGFRYGCGEAECASCKGEPMPYHGLAIYRENSFATIDLVYDPLTTTPKQLWWVFLHELGHILQKTEQASSGHGIDWSGNPIAQVADEIDAWERARKYASLTSWPPDADFEAMRRRCLDSYGIAA